MEEYSGYVGLDVHKEMIAVAVAYPGRSKPESLGMIWGGPRLLDQNRRQLRWNLLG